VIGLILIGQNHLYVKILFTRNPLFRSASDDSALFYKSEISVPCQPSGRHVISSGRSSVHSSIRPDDVPYRPDARQTIASSVRTLICIDKLLFGCLSSPSRRLSVIGLHIFFPSSNKGRLLQPSERRGYPSRRAHT
jgi:hypothetical protein